KKPNPKLKDPVVEKPLITSERVETSEPSGISPSHDHEPNSPKTPITEPTPKTSSLINAENFSSTSSLEQPSKPKRIKCKFFNCSNFLTNAEKIYCSQCYQRQKSGIIQHGLEQSLDLRTPSEKFTIETGQLASPLVETNHNQPAAEISPNQPNIFQSSQPAIQIPTIIEPTREQKLAARKENYQNSRDTQLAAAEVKKQEKERLAPKGTAIGTAAVAGAGALYVGIACVKGFLLLKGAAATAAATGAVATKITAAACF
ncbi:14834_t:CDS:2, partial [Racocetra fulgida]